MGLYGNLVNLHQTQHVFIYNSTYLTQLGQISLINNYIKGKTTDSNNLPGPPSMGFTEKHISFRVSSLKTLSYTGLFRRKTRLSTPPFSSCFKISEKVEQQKTKHNIQLKTARSVKMPNSARQLIHLQFHWDHRDCGNAAFRNFSYVTKHSRDFLCIISRLRPYLH